MFLCVNSNNNREQTKDEDVASVFTTNLEQPMKLKDFTIELVDCVVTANNLVTLTNANNNFVFRMGDDSVSEQYLCSILPGRYETDELCELILLELVDKTPLKAWQLNHKKFTVIFSSNKFVLTYTSNNSIAPSDTINTLISNENKQDYGYRLEIIPSSASELEFLSKFAGLPELNNEPFATETNRDVINEPVFSGGSLTGLDVADSLNTQTPDYVDNRTVTGFKDCGIAEDGGSYTTIYKPMLSVKKSAYCSPSPTANNNESHYFIIENNTTGTIYDNQKFTESLLNPASKTILPPLFDPNAFAWSVISPSGLMYIKPPPATLYILSVDFATALILVE